MVVEHLGVGGAPLRLGIAMNLINELRELAEDLYVNGYNRYSSAMSKAADELAKWEAVFGHLGDTPDECGNAIIAARDELEERCATLTDALIRIVNWSEHNPQCAIDHGSNGVRNYYRNIARSALEESK